MNGYDLLLSLFGIIGFLITIKMYRHSKIKKEPVFLLNIEQSKQFLNVIENAKKDYFTYTLKEQLKKEYKDTYTFFSNRPFSNIKADEVVKFKNIYSNLDNNVKCWNELYIENELKLNKDMFDNIDGKSLDQQQRKAVVVDEINNLVLAGAGSGKTLTISAKVKYLVDRKKILPEEILLISFTRKAAEEMQQRISDKIQIQVEAKTFHKLGLEIITKHRRNRPDIANELDNIIKLYFTKNIYNDKKQLQALITFFGYYLNIPKDLENFKNLGESYDFYRSVDFETIKGKLEKYEKINFEANRLKINNQTLQGERVKSLEELMIANFLFLNGIDYIYEYKYPFKQEDPYRKKYRPDFYLPNYNIYIEHFGITKDNRVPWLNKIEERKYLDGIRWKRETHKKNKTILIETYSYYNKEGVLLTKLEEKLKHFNVCFNNQDYEKIYAKVFANNEDSYFSQFKKLISSFIELFKSNDYSVEYFAKIKENSNDIDNTFLTQRCNLFVDIVKPIFIMYQEFLRNNDMIDFNDMINEATKIIKDGELEFKYKYIIIDEYQDISMSRFNLIKEIKNKTNAKVMCVGDDWQSIYRFAGSDINLFTDFDKYLGYYELLKIENTYRNSQELINIAGNFIMKNKKQLMKDLKSFKHHSNPIRLITYDGDINQAISKAIEEIVNSFGTEAQITVIGRNNFDIDFIDREQGAFKLKRTNDQVLILSKKYPKLKINFLTAHRSKGLEADNVIIINLENKLLGFPNKISDDPILSLVLTEGDSYEFAEERRLFYVALTRTKNATYLVAPNKGQSIFCEELVKEFKINVQTADATQPSFEKIPCPKCQKGYLVVRENKNDNSKFLGCSNYPFCDLTFKNLEIINDHIKCTSCGGYMVKRKGVYGEFYGCTNFPYCNNVIPIEVIRNSPLIENHDSKEIEKVNEEKLGEYASEEDDKVYKNIISDEKWISQIEDILNDNTTKSESHNQISKIEGKNASEYTKIKNDNIVNKRSSKEKPYMSIFKLDMFVKHKEFGKGKIINIKNNIIQVEFSNSRKLNFSLKTCEEQPILEIINNNEYLNEDANKLDQLKRTSDKLYAKKQYNRLALNINTKIINYGCKEYKYYFRVAECYKEMDNIDEAIEIYKLILEKSPNNKYAKDKIEIYKLGKQSHHNIHEKPYNNDFRNSY